MDRNTESDGKGDLVDKPVSLEGYRQRRDLGVEKFMTSLEDGFTEEQKEKVPGIMKEVVRFITDLNITRPLEEVVEYAREIGDNRLALWALAFYSQAFVAGVEDSKQRDSMAGEMLDKLARLSIREASPQK